MSDKIEVSNCPTCGHFPTQIIDDKVGIKHRAIPSPVDTLSSAIQEAKVRMPIKPEGIPYTILVVDGDQPLERENGVYTTVTVLGLDTGSLKDSQLQAALCAMASYGNLAGEVS